VDPRAGLDAVKRKTFVSCLDTNQNSSAAEPVDCRYTDELVRAYIQVFVRQTHRWGIFCF
jgi:hypothetical protein